MPNNNPKIKLTEGNYYPFKLTGNLIMPDGSEQFILKDPNGVKHLVDAAPYSKYGFRNKQTITCRIDKINCTGRIYIEPAHPYYMIGEQYPFKFEALRNVPFEKSELAVFTDVLGLETYIPSELIPVSLTPGDFLDCYVDRIKRGKVYVSYLHKEEDFSGMEVGENYPFQITGELSLGEKYDFFIIRNPGKKEFKLRRKYYIKYGLTKGDKIQCALYKEGNQFFLEPEHPEYEPGKSYYFNILHEGHITEYPNIKKEAIYLFNQSGKEIVVKKENIKPDMVSGNRIRCLVTGIRKSIITCEPQ